ncbi:hypothetical protein STEG23_021120 [Scotinomys teguina]
MLFLLLCAFMLPLFTVNGAEQLIMQTSSFSYEDEAEDAFLSDTKSPGRIKIKNNLQMCKIIWYPSYEMPKKKEEVKEDEEGKGEGKRAVEGERKRREKRKKLLLK